jgi:hypothetical protein
MRGAWSGGGELVGSAGVRWRAADCATTASARSRGMGHMTVGRRRRPGGLGPM